MAGVCVRGGGGSYMHTTSEKRCKALRSWDEHFTLRGIFPVENSLSHSGEKGVMSNHNDVYFIQNSLSITIAC